MPINLNNITTTKVKKLTATFFHPRLTGKGGAVGFLQAPYNSYISTLIDARIMKLNTDSDQIKNLKKEETLTLPWTLLFNVQGLIGSSIQNLNNKVSEKFFNLEDITTRDDVIQLDGALDFKNKTRTQGLQVFTSGLPVRLILEDYNKAKGIKPFDLSLIGLLQTVYIKDVDNLNDPDFPLKIVDSTYTVDDVTWTAVQNDKLALITYTSSLQEFTPTGQTKLKELKTSSVLASYANLLNDYSTDIYTKALEIADTYADKNNPDKKNFELIFNSHYQISKRSNNITNKDFARLYRRLQKSVNDKTIKSVDANRITSGNLRLMLAAKLEDLRDLQDKDAFYHAPNDQNVTDIFTQIKDYSPEQLKVITTKKPLVVAAAGAGTGKSHTLTGRLRFLKAQGQDLNHVLVLSFTNTAAKNISGLYPGIQSLTLADMFNQIYNATFPDQVLTNPNTLSNTLRLLEPKSKMFSSSKGHIEQVINQFAKLLDELEPKGFKKSDLNHVMADMSALIQDNMHDILLILNSVKQTTLSLQPIIINAALSIGWPNLQIPKSLEKIDIIITDESQDISTFEYIMLLDMALRRKAQLMIVGDGSQTLYEFRNSNPKFLTSIQASKVFENFNLTTNYRSNGTILAYANPLLSIIEANSEANIQLIPQDLREIQPSKDDFKKHVEIITQALPNGKNAESLKDAIETGLTKDKTIDWVSKALARGEKVAVIGSTNASVTNAYDTLPDVLRTKNPQLTVDAYHLMSNRQKPNDIASSLLTEIKRSELENIALDKTVDDAIADILEVFTKLWNLRMAKSKNAVNYGLPNIVTTLVKNAFKETGVQFAFSKDDKSNFAGLLINSIIQGETKYNDFAQYLTVKDDTNKELENNNLIFTTGHSAKGLEFDNVVVIYDESHAKSGQQDSLRMLYVTLTRAKQNELIINIVKSKYGRSVGNTFLALSKTPISSLELMSKHYAETGEYETVIRKGTDSDTDDTDADDSKD